MQAAWRTEGLEGLLSHYVANATFARAVYESARDALNIDDGLAVESGFVRSLGHGAGFAADSLADTARERAQQRPVIRGDHVDWARVDFEHQAFLLMTGFKTDPSRVAPEYAARLEVLTQWAASNLPGALEAFRRLTPAEQASPIALERLALAEMLAYAADPQAEAKIAALAAEQATEAATLRAIWLLRTGRTREALAAFDDALQRYRRDPWPMPGMMQRAVQMLAEWGTEDLRVAPDVLRILSRPFSVYANEPAREQARLRVAGALGQGRRECLDLLSSMEPNVPWTLPMLRFRAGCYATHASPLRDRAQADVELFQASEPEPFGSFVHGATEQHPPAAVSSAPPVRK
jgi:hypothetical protein